MVEERMRRAEKYAQNQRWEFDGAMSDFLAGPYVLCGDREDSGLKPVSVLLLHYRC